MREIRKMNKKERQIWDLLEKKKASEFKRGYETGLQIGIVEGRQRQIEEFKQLFKIGNNIYPNEQIHFD